KEGIRIDLYANEITFRRMIENLEALRNATGRLKELRNILLGIKEPSQVKEEVEISEFFNKKLNDTQKTAVKLALGAKDFFLIHGPPGTGKTVTLTELILQLVKQGYKVIATADSNIAVDNLLLNLSQYSLKLVRIGHPARIMEELERFSLYALFEQDELSNQIKEKWEQVQLLIKKRDQFIKPVPSLKRGLSEEEIIELAKKKKGTRGIKKETIISMANWIKLNREIEEQINNIKNLEMQVFKKIISQADVVLSTNSMAKSEFLEDFVFDVAVIDEGSQQVEPSTLIPIVKAKRFFIAGDHKQLPPTILSEKAKKDLEKTLFEKLIERHPNLSIMLKVQYRMNEKIMKFPNEEFYEGKLVSAGGGTSLRYPW
ncbi:MAG TPA: IGHMBP2 family helicase, partial [Pyrodictiaceae archaeon]|nr:IGHMBP2 family helicase [Pyrodictiaceae archaeon]